MKKYSVHLTNCGNIDHGQNPHSWLPGTRTGWLEVDSVHEASVLCRAYIDAYDLGGGNWSGGEIKESETGLVLACVAYNGRVFDLRGGKTTSDFVEYPILASEMTFSLPPVKRIDCKDVVRILSDKASSGIDVFVEPDNWFGDDSPYYDSPLGADLNVFEGERGEWVVDIYDVKIENGTRATGTSGLGYQILRNEDVESIRKAYATNTHEQPDSGQTASQGWTLTDASTNQYFKKIGEHRFLYKEDRMCAVTGETFAYESEMDLSDYDDDEIENKISAYYKSLNEVKEIYGSNWEQIVLECIFEQELSEREEGFFSESQGTSFAYSGASDNGSAAIHHWPDECPYAIEVLEREESERKSNLFGSNETPKEDAGMRSVPR